MVSLGEIQTDFHNALQENPMPVRLQYFTESFSGTDYDNAYRTKSGSDVWANSMYFPVGATDHQFLEQGLTKVGDMKLFLHGSVAINENVKIGLGSPVSSDQIYAINQNGIKEWRALNGIVYTQSFIRHLPAGSFVTEY